MESIEKALADRSYHVEAPVDVWTASMTVMALVSVLALISVNGYFQHRNRAPYGN